MQRFKTGLILLLFLPLCPALAAEKSDRPSFENEFFRLRLSPRTPNQIAAFYTGRGFPQNAIEEVRKVCFITVGLRNKGTQPVRYDLAEWRFSTRDETLPRILRTDWKQRWQDLGLEKRFQSTFRWTLMPESLSFYPYEGEGGNITLPRTAAPIRLQAKVYVGEEKSFAITLDNIRCADDPVQ